MKSVRTWSYCSPYFPAFGLNTDRYSVAVIIQTECGNIWIRITPNTDTFYSVTFMYALNACAHAKQVIHFFKLKDIAPAIQI